MAQPTVSDDNLLAAIPEHWLALIVVILTCLAIYGLIRQWWLIHKHQKVTSVSTIFFLTNSLGALTILLEGGKLGASQFEIWAIVFTNTFILPVLIFLILYSTGIYKKNNAFWLNQDLRKRNIIRIVFYLKQRENDRFRTGLKVKYKKKFRVLLILFGYQLLWLLMGVVIVWHAADVFLPAWCLQVMPVVLLVGTLWLAWLGIYNLAVYSFAVTLFWLIVPYAFLVVLYGPVQQLLLLWFVWAGATSDQLVLHQQRPEADVRVKIGLEQYKVDEPTAVLSRERLIIGVGTTAFWITLLWSISFWQAIAVSFAGLVTQGLILTTYFIIKSRLKKQKASTAA